MAAKTSASVSWPRISIVIPTLNEARNLPHVFKALPSDTHEVIVVDGYSVDDTLAVVRELKPEARIVMQTRRGKGNALACGCMAATGDIIALIDADGSNDAAEISRFVSVLLSGADFAKGTRFGQGGGSADITRLRRLGNRVLTVMVNLLYGARYTDLCYGFNVFWRRHLSAVGFDADTVGAIDTRDQRWGDGFEIETLINIRIAAAKLAVVEVPSFEHARIHGVSNLSALSDGLRVLRTILRERSVARRAAVPLSGLPALPNGPQDDGDVGNVDDPGGVDGNRQPSRSGNDSEEDSRVQLPRDGQARERPSAVETALNHPGRG
jgi:glycosyltransferase involved in cell wall biosynthesis